jgi:NAD(P)-dependent dehydrogenase (short-subunit alcohol dehydrogenase family)
MVDPIDVSRAVLYLVGESGRYITGIQLPVDAGITYAS